MESSVGFAPSEIETVVDHGAEVPVGHLEIEKKFIIKHPPENYQQYPHAFILQCYSEYGTRHRMILKGNEVEYISTMKRSTETPGAKMEYEKPISSGEFYTAWDNAVGRLAKTRYYIPEGEYTVELDVYEAKKGEKHGERLEGRMTAEVEFPTEEAQQQFVPPEWFKNKHGDVRDVTGVKEYSNKNLAKHGWPPKKK